MKKENSPLLKIEARQIHNGISLRVLGKNYKIEYSEKIWQKTPAVWRKALLENITFAETNFLPLMLNKPGASFNFGHPLMETLLFKSQLYDMMDCENEDGAECTSYLKKFYNLEYKFTSPESAYPVSNNASRRLGKNKTAVIPFSFGKESLATFALCRELGIRPVLVYCQEPVQPYEEKYKLKKLKELQKEFKVKTYFIKHEPGLFRFGKAFGIKTGTEIGWGAQMALLNLLCLPFVYAENADYLLSGNEHLNNEIQLIKGWKVYYSADQTINMIAAQNNFIRLLTGGRCEVKSSLEPLEEISIMSLLHHRYPKIGRYQFSCMAEKPLSKNSQWCHSCYKCCRMYIFALACRLTPKQLGFIDNNFFKNSPGFRNYLKTKYLRESLDKDLDLALYILHKRNVPLPFLKQFRNNRLKKIKPWLWHVNYFNRLKSAYNLPVRYRQKMLKIFNEELRYFKKVIP